MAEMTNERIVGMTKENTGIKTPDSITRPKYDLNPDEKSKPFADEVCVAGMVITVSGDGQDLTIQSAKRLNSGGMIEHKEFRYLLADASEHVEGLDPGRYTNTSNAAKHMGVHPSTLARWRASGMLVPVFEGPSHRGGFRTRYYDIKDLDRIVAHYNNGTGPFVDSTRYQPGHQIIRTNRGAVKDLRGATPPVTLEDLPDGTQEILGSRNPLDTGKIRRRGPDARSRSKLGERARDIADNPMFTGRGDPSVKKTKKARAKILRTTLSTMEFAKIFKCSDAHIRTRHAEKLLPFEPTDTGDIKFRGFRWPKAEVLAWARQYGLI